MPEQPEVWRAMLTRELLKFQWRNGIRPLFVDASDPERLALAAELLAVYRGGVEARMRRGELEELADVLLKGAHDPVFAAGLNKLILDRCSFDPAREVDYPAERRRLFTHAAAQLQAAGGDRERYGAAVRALGGACDFMAGDIYGDLPDNERLTGWRELRPTELLHRYNLALVQGLLFYAGELQVTAADPDPAELRRLFKYLKFFRLLAEVRRLPEERRGGAVGPVTGVSIAVSGPYSLFANTRKYALQLASFFPALVNLAKWTLRAEIRMPNRTGVLKLDHSAGLVSHYRNFSSYVPEEIRMFHRLFREQCAEWRIVGESPFLPGGPGGELIFPDLSFRRSSDGRLVHLELFHRWHRGPLDRRLELLREHPELPLILGIDRALADDDAFQALLDRDPDFERRIYRFRDFPGVDRTFRMLEKFSREPEK